ncbi:ribonuclease E [Rhodovulum iodosum]|uniref:Ribonuclease E n=1 Tax=Rhodovulum iodosum TaxID=68291 RepID=A0ABV3XVV5_9RHOB|nr:ribonuclease E/G [Rhodovulum robiginosum]RSK31988.1 Rne/Rng family ribonuclease [Rhodovulum robiginosum]
MAKKMLIDATHAEECRVVVVDGTKVEEFDFEAASKRQLAGNIYLAKVTRVEPSLQAAFVDYGGNRHGFLAFSEIHPDYYQIPVADREALLAEERAYAESLNDDEAKEAPKPRRSRRSRSRSDSKAEKTRSGDAVETRDVSADIPGMDVVDLGEDAEATEPEILASQLGDVPAATDVPAGPQGAAPEAAEAEAPAAAAPESDAGAAEPEAPAAEDPTAESAAPETPVADDEAGKADEGRGDGDQGDDDEDGEAAMPDAASRDDQIESVGDEDVSDDIRPRKPRPRRYKIQEVVKVRQIMLVQVVKEERGNKGAALTTYLSLAGRYCVLMPNTARGGGISRKITNATDRKKLKQIAGELDVPEGAGLIIRTAGANRTKAEIKRDYEYLQRMWEQIRELTLKSIAPAPIYEEGDLIKRSIRDLYNREIDEVLVEGEAGYRVAKDFMKMIMPSHAKNVKHYHDPMPLLARFQVESYLSSMFNPTVQLRSGGYIVIGVTEALVAIDVNSGRATKEGSIEETALKTNLEAAEEVARQLRLRDLAGLIVIDFIDMDERKNNAAVEKRLKDKLKTDRARIQLGRISGFGLLEMSRQRLRPGMIEATTQPCPHCHGTGLIRSDDNLALSILRQIEEEGVRGRSKEVLIKAPVGIVNFLMNQKREHVAQIEARYGLSVRIEADSFLISPDYAIERFKTATRAVPEVAVQVISVDTSDLQEAEAVEVAEVVPAVEDTPEEPRGDDGQSPSKKRRRRRRKKKPNGNGEQPAPQEAGSESTEAEAPAEAGAESEAAQPSEDKPKRSRSRGGRSRNRRSRSDEAPSEAEATPVEAAPAESSLEPEAPAPVAEAEQVTDMPAPDAAPEPATAAQAPEPAPVAQHDAPAPVAQEEEQLQAAHAPEPAPDAQEGQSAPAEAPQPEPQPEPSLETEFAGEPSDEDDSQKPKKRGWWALSR